MVVVGLCALVVGGTVWWRSNGHSIALAQEPPQLLTQLERDAVVTLLKDISLDRDALIALNADSEQAASILSTARTWRETNASTLVTLKNTIDQKVVAVRKLEKAERMGPADPGRAAALALAREQLGTARASHRSALSPLESSVNTLLSESQRTTWNAIRHGHGRKMPIRMLALTDTQRLAVSRAHRTYERQRRAATTDQERSTAVSTWESALKQILTQDQENVMDAYYSNYGTASGAAAEAWDSVLAVEEA